MDNKAWLTRYREAGFSFFHTGARDKKVFKAWTEYQTRKPTDLEIDAWLRLPVQNYAIVTGEISGLVVFDVDTKNGGDPSPFQGHGFHEIRTPSGGYHFYTLYDPLLKSTRHRKEYQGILKGVDVQSERALVFAPPSFFPGYGTYTLAHDAPLKRLPDELLGDVLAALEPEEEAEDYTPYIAPQNAEMRRPGDIFNALATWEDVLIPLGWKKVGPTKTGVQYWRRPGKKEGISASTGWKGYDLFFPYTTSVDGLDQKKGYTKFKLLATLKYKGDFRSAAKALVVENYRLVHKLV